MIETQNFDKYPVFGEAASKTAPDAAKYSAGFLPADVLPAEWLNWAWAKNSKGISDLNAGVTAMEAEINAVLDSGGVVPDNTAKQLVAAIKNIILKQTGTLTNLHTANKATIVAACNELLSEIRKEAQNRQSAITSLTQAFQQAINKEAQERIRSDNAEAQARTQGDKSIADYGDPSGNRKIQVGYAGPSIQAGELLHLAGYTQAGTKLKDVTEEAVRKLLRLDAVDNTSDSQKSVKYAENAGSAQADGGNADTVDGYHAGNGAGMLVPVVAFNVGENAGYIKLGNGLIVQWGKKNANKTHIDFPIVFSKCFYFNFIVSRTTSTDDGWHYYNNLTTRGVTVLSLYETGMWIAIGI
ncbi:MAG: gp53-like domain-containing protein [Treponema sp.]